MRRVGGTESILICYALQLIAWPIDRFRNAKRIIFKLQRRRSSFRGTSSTEIERAWIFPAAAGTDTARFLTSKKSIKQFFFVIIYNRVVTPWTVSTEEIK